MANITPNIKDGKTVSYKFRCCLGRKENGKQIFKCTTWHIPNGLTPSKAERLAQKTADEWEKQVKQEYEQELIKQKLFLWILYRIYGFLYAFVMENINILRLSFISIL